MDKLKKALTGRDTVEDDEERGFVATVLKWEKTWRIELLI